MAIIGELLLPTLLGYLLNLAAGERSAAFAAAREKTLKDNIEKNEALRKALISTHSIREDLRTTCIEFARNRNVLGVPVHEEPLWQLFTDDVFQADLAEWLMAGGIAEGDVVKARILQTMETALTEGGANAEQIAVFKAGYFETVEKAIYGHPVLAHWRHQLSLDYLREQMAVLRQRADEAVGIYSSEKQKAALDRYCTKALEAWDIIDLSNLPEPDLNIASQQLLLRQLYMPLRMEIEPTRRGEGDDMQLARLEELRETRRHTEAGHVFADESAFLRRRVPRSPVGEKLADSRRLVVLGDPGSGKTTLLRWLATAYLLRHRSDAAFSQVPDTNTLPDQPWIPVLIRCRDLGEDDLCRCFTDFLTQHLNKSELCPEEANVMRAVVLDRIARGEALLLVDGLDEITNPQVRMMFCQELERTAARYPSPIVVTSRIVGYRDMPYRMRSGFQHGVIAELNRSDKDVFAQRWVAVTEQEMTASEKAKRVQGLLDALHSSDRIERLTGNPMLLTTLALVERKSGKLPNRRSELYYEAVHVLLNFNPRHRSLDKAEAIPQLAYLAFQMCYLGVQRLTEDEILTLLEKFRQEYPHVRAVRPHEPQVFLTLLEAQSSILIRAGSIWKNSIEPEKRVWEFRHLTFQEYLASRALIDGRYPDRDKTKSLAEQVAPLAGKVEEPRRRRRALGAEPESEVPESWREALRLLVAECKDDDVDNVMLAIFKPATGEDGIKTRRPRAVLAALCLADEPNVSEETALKILGGFVTEVREGDAGGHFRSSLSAAAAELGKCIWAGPLKQRLMHEYLLRSPNERVPFGSLWAMIEAHGSPDAIETFRPWWTGVQCRIEGVDEIERVSAALVVMTVAFLEKALLAPGLINALFTLLPATPPARLASAWALSWLSKNAPTKWDGKQPVWRPQGEEVGTLVDILRSTESAEYDTVRWLLNLLGSSLDPRAVHPCVQSLQNENARIRIIAAGALAKLGDKQAVAPLLGKLDDQEPDVRQAVIEALAQLGDKQALAPLLGKLDDQEPDVRQAAIEALAKLSDKQAVLPLLAKLNDQDSDVRLVAIAALARLGDRQAVAPLLAKLNDQEPDFRQPVIEALARLGDKRAVAPLLAKLNDQEPDVRHAVIEALARLGDKRAVAPLLAKLDDQEPDVRQAAIKALARLGANQAVAPLLAKLDDQDPEIAAFAAFALQSLGEPKGNAAHKRFLTSAEPKFRLAAVSAYAQDRDHLDQCLLSRDLDAAEPAVDSQEIVSEERIEDASNRYNIPPDQVRSRYEVMAVELPLRLSWRK